jgi:hypothetical protein
MLIYQSVCDKNCGYQDMPKDIFLANFPLTILEDMLEIRGIDMCWIFFGGFKPTKIGTIM